MPKGIPNPINKVCRLRKFLHGLKQVSRQWFSKLDYTFVSLGYTLFLNKASTHITILAVYIDGILIIGSDYQEIQHVKHCLNDEFAIKDLETLHYFLGLEVSQTNQGIVVFPSQDMLLHPYP